MKKTVKLKKSYKAYTYEGNFYYLALYDTRSGRSNRYTLMILNSEDPVVIGRDLPLRDVRTLIVRFEALAPRDWFGERSPVLTTMKLVTAFNWI